MPTFDLQWRLGICRPNEHSARRADSRSSLLTTAYSSLAYALQSAGRGDLVAWSDWSDWSASSRAKLRGWTKVFGTSVFVVAPDYDVVDVALSDAKIVWMGATSLQSVQGSYGSATLYWSPFTTSPGGIVIHKGPPPA